MTALNQPALAFEQAELAGPGRPGTNGRGDGPSRRRVRRVGMERINWSTTTIIRNGGAEPAPAKTRWKGWSKVSRFPVA